MTQSAQPLGAKPATITVRVKTLVVTAALMLVAAAAVLGLHWVTGMRPLVAGATGTGPIGLTPLPGTNGERDTGPPVYEWQRDGRFVITLWLHDSASVPVTVTGADHPPAD